MLLNDFEQLIITIWGLCHYHLKTYVREYYITSSIDTNTHISYKYVPIYFTSLCLYLFVLLRIKTFETPIIVERIECSTLYKIEVFCSKLLDLFFIQTLKSTWTENRIWICLVWLSKKQEYPRNKYREKCIENLWK